MLLSPIASFHTQFFLFNDHKSANRSAVQMRAEVFSTLFPPLEAEIAQRFVFSGCFLIIRHLVQSVFCHWEWSLPVNEFTFFPLRLPVLPTRMSMNGLDRFLGHLRLRHPAGHVLCVKLSQRCVFVCAGADHRLWVKMERLPVCL